MKLPFFSLTNYTSIMALPYSQQDTSTRIEIRDLIDTLDTDFVGRFSAVDTRQLSTYVDTETLTWTCHFWDVSCTLEQGLIACKLGCPTLHACEYFFWNTGEGSHRGIDLIMPQWAPITSFSDGEVVRIKHRDGSTNNEGNTIVILTPDDHYLCYEHLETIEVTLGQQVTPGQVIASCGSTGNSTQYHLHLQIDTDLAPFHPYRHADTIHMYDYNVDPIQYLQSISPKQIFIDLPDDTEQQQAIIALHTADIVKWFDRKVFPENSLKRYEMALLIDRILQKYDYYDQLPIRIPTYTDYVDTNIDDPELPETLKRLQKYGIMKGHANHFYPLAELKGEELLALLGRIFYNLEDTTATPRRQPYQDTFIQELIISSTRGYIRHAIPRKEVFVILWKVMKGAGLM